MAPMSPPARRFQTTDARVADIEVPGEVLHGESRVYTARGTGRALRNSA